MANHKYSRRSEVLTTLVDYTLGQQRKFMFKQVKKQNGYWDSFWDSANVGPRHGNTDPALLCAGQVPPGECGYFGEPCFTKTLVNCHGVRRGYLGGEGASTPLPKKMKTWGILAEEYQSRVGGLKSCWMGKGCLALYFSGR